MRAAGPVRRGRSGRQSRVPPDVIGVERDAEQPVRSGSRRSHRSSAWANGVHAGPVGGVYRMQRFDGERHRCAPGIIEQHAAMPSSTMARAAPRSLRGARSGAGELRQTSDDENQAGRAEGDRLVDRRGDCRPAPRRAGPRRPETCRPGNIPTARARPFSRRCAARSSPTAAT